MNTKTDNQTATDAPEAPTLKANTEYVNRFGERVKIMGLARRADGQKAFWSLQGDHYTPDGRLIWGKPLNATSLRNIKP